MGVEYGDIGSLCVYLVFVNFYVALNPVCSTLVPCELCFRVVFSLFVFSLFLAKIYLVLRLFVTS